jgi:23S rRNA (adenine2503-C2)-methyltransferase
METNIDIRGLGPTEISEWLESEGEKPFHGKQIFRWLHSVCVDDYSQMTDLSRSLQAKLAVAWPIHPLHMQQELISRDGTRKYLWQLADGQCIESVVMTHQEASGHLRQTLCISTQVGCAMGCVFCATGLGGFKRNLTVAEIVGQVLDVTRQRQLTQPDFEIHNVVYMGMGEPLLNYEAVVKSIRLLNNPLGQQIGIRRITVSTCGLPHQIRRLAKEGLDIVLAISLHSSEHGLRSQLMPVNRQYPLADVLAACREYVAETKRRLTFEYTLIQGVNTSAQQAKDLAGLLKGIPCNVNLIPVNGGEHGFKRPSRTTQNLFRQILIDCGLEAVIREEKGADIAGACGQLAGQAQQGE